MQTYANSESAATQGTQLPKRQGGIGRILSTSRSISRAGVAVGAFCLFSGWSYSSEADASDTVAFTFTHLVSLAQERASRPFESEPAHSVPEEQKLTYTEYRGIDYREERAIWRNAQLPFELQFYHCGYLFAQPVALNILEDENVRPTAFSADEFTFATDEIQQKALATPGFAGFRVHTRDSAGDSREVLSFLGASYFRGAPLNGRFGTSARGLAIDIASPDPEEFPAFHTFWIERPRPTADSLSIYALMDSPRVTGAYQFQCQARDATAVEVDAHLFLRKPVQRIGIAPLTSEFFYGENQPPREPDPQERPEVHDCDGLLIAAGSGEWLWRPLSNPAVNHLDSYTVDSLRGFGLLQRDRDPAHYADPRTSLELRTNAWVKPLEGFGAGAVQLFRFPAPGEWEDNINAFWSLAQTPEPGQELHVRYVLHFSTFEPIAHRGAKVTSTSRRSEEPGSIQYAVEFTGIPKTLDSDSKIEGIVSAAGGKVSNVQVEPQHTEGIVLLRFALNRSTVENVTLRAYLRSGEDALSETWTDTWER